MNHLGVVAFMSAVLLCTGERIDSNDICVGVANKVFMTNVAECDSYFVCMNQRPVEGRCPPPFLFSEAKQKCDWADQVECFKCPSNELSTFRYQQSCSTYIMCFDGYPLLRRCAEGTSFDVSTGRCDLAENVDCETSLCPNDNDPDDIRFIPSKSDCDKYYVCVNGKPSPQECATGLYFNSEVNECDLASNVQCNITMKSRSLTPLSRPLYATDNFICPSNETFYHALATSSSQYVVCRNGHGAVMSCTPGLVYNEESQDCVRPIH